jgi:hypothetical protein
MGRYAEALSELQNAAGIKGSWSADAQGYLKLMGAPDSPAAPANIAVSYALAGDRKKAFAYLEKAYSGPASASRHLTRSIPIRAG